MFVEAEIWTVARTDKGNAVLVKPLGSERAVPIFIGQLEAQSILIGLGNVPMPRPLTHDLFISVMDKVNINVERVEITDLKDGTFYARILLKQGMKKISIDSRPSDALGLAARLRCPLYISETVVDEAGVAINLITEEEGQEGETELDTGEIEKAESGSEEEPAQQDSERTRLEEALQKAIDEENYEEAARIRDQMKDL
jgi:bifunctional DNase/RNase